MNAGNKQIGADKKKEYRTEDLIVYWNPKECSHAGKCWETLPQVFKPEERPWVTMTAAAPEEIIKAIDKCPTNALKYSLPEGSKVDRAKAKGPGSVDFKAEKSEPVQIRMVKDGPLIVEGLVRIIDSEGNAMKDLSKTVLCRCGLSGNTPFCDGSHFDRSDK